MTTADDRLTELEKRVSEHLAGRPVKVIWGRQGPSASGVGQVLKSFQGELLINIAPMDDVNSRYKVWLHEIAHIHNGDHEFVARSNDHKLAAGSIRRSPEVRAAWRADPRELAAQRLADEWLRYADRHAHEFWRAGRDKMTCKLLALLSWEGE